VAATAEVQDHSGGRPRSLPVTAAAQRVAVERLLLNAEDTVVFRLLIDETAQDVVPSFQAAGFKFERFYRQGIQRNPIPDDPTREIAAFVRRYGRLTFFLFYVSVLIASSSFVLNFIFRLGF
jgi:hypothetical protein